MDTSNTNDLGFPNGVVLHLLQKIYDADLAIFESKMKTQSQLVLKDNSDMEAKEENQALFF